MKLHRRNFQRRFLAHSTLYPFMSMSRNFYTRGISSATRVILRDLTLIWHCVKWRGHWAILYNWRSCSDWKVSAKTWRILRHWGTAITGGSARRKKVSAKTWRILAWNDAITMATGSSGSWKNHWPGSKLSLFQIPRPPGFNKNIYWFLVLLQ